MAKFFNDSENAIAERANALQDFSDLLFAELSTTVFGERAPEVLAAHLGIKTEDVQEWLRGESLPSRKLLVRLTNILRGDNWFKSVAGGQENSTWSKISEFVHEVENVQALKDVKITRQS